MATSCGACGREGPDEALPEPAGSSAHPCSVEGLGQTDAGSGGGGGIRSLERVRAAETALSGACWEGLCWVLAPGHSTCR